MNKFIAIVSLLSLTAGCVSTSTVKTATGSSDTAVTDLGVYRHQGYQSHGLNETEACIKDHGNTEHNRRACQREVDRDFVRYCTRYAPNYGYVVVDCDE